MQHILLYVPASSIWPTAKDYTDKGPSPEGYLRGYNIEVKKPDGTTGWLSCVWISETIQEYINKESTQFWFSDYGWTWTGRVCFRGYAVKKWSDEERDYYVEQVEVAY